MKQPWRTSWKADPVARAIADRHYNRQKVGAAQFVPPGRSVVLLHAKRDALWITSWPFGEFVRHAWPGAWVCSAFRNERPGRRASDLVRAAVAATRAVWEPPPEGLVTFVNRSKVREKESVGRCFLEAGFDPVGETAGGLLALLLLPSAMPDAKAAPPVLALRDHQRDLFEVE